MMNIITDIQSPSKFSSLLLFEEQESAATGL